MKHWYVKRGQNTLVYETCRQINVVYKTCEQIILMYETCEQNLKTVVYGTEGHHHISLYKHERNKKWYTSIHNTGCTYTHK